MNIGLALWRNFLGTSPNGYKIAIIGFLILNPLCLSILGDATTAGIILIEFIGVLLMRLKCHPLLPGGLIALQTVLLELTTPATILEAISRNTSVILFLIFMASAVLFAKELVLYLFTFLFVRITSKTRLALSIYLLSAILSAFLGAIPIIALFAIATAHFLTLPATTTRFSEAESNHFSLFMRSFLIHGTVGAVLGGACTLVGEPQNLMIAQATQWDFTDYVKHLAPISLPVLAVGGLTCIALERIKRLGFGHALSETTRSTLLTALRPKRSDQYAARITSQALAIGIVIIALLFQQANVGLLGLMLLVLITSTTGISQHNQLGHVFAETLPHVALLIVFFIIISAIQSQHLLQPLFQALMQQRAIEQPGFVYLANGIMSQFSDSIFTAALYLDETSDALDGATISKAHFDRLAVAIAAGSNILSIGTPHGHTAFLLILTSSLAPLVQLSYRKMLIMLLPYSVMTGVMGFLCVRYGLF